MRWVFAKTTTRNQYTQRTGAGVIDVVGKADPLGVGAYSKSSGKGIGVSACNQVVDRIKKAFPDSTVFHPGNGRLVDISSYEPEVEFLSRYECFPWDRIDRLELNREHSCIAYLSRRGFFYVLPAYLNIIASEGTDDDVNEWSGRLVKSLYRNIRCEGLLLTEEQFDVVEVTLFANIERYGDPGDLAYAGKIRRLRKFLYHKGFLSKLFRLYYDYVEMRRCFK